MFIESEIQKSESWKIFFPMIYVFKEHVKIVKIYMVKVNVTVVSKLGIMWFLQFKGKYLKIMSFLIKLCNQTFYYYSLATLKLFWTSSLENSFFCVLRGWFCCLKNFKFKIYIVNCKKCFLQRLTIMNLSYPSCVVFLLFLKKWA